MTPRTDGLVVTVVLALVALGLGLTLVFAAARTRVEHVSPWLTPGTVCCPAGTTGTGGGR